MWRRLLLALLHPLLFLCMSLFHLLLTRLVSLLLFQLLVFLILFLLKLLVFLLLLGAELVLFLLILSVQVRVPGVGSLRAHMRRKFARVCCGVWICRARIGWLRIRRAWPGSFPFVGRRRSVTAPFSCRNDAASGKSL